MAYANRRRNGADWSAEELDSCMVNAAVRSRRTRLMFCVLTSSCVRSPVPLNSVFSRSRAVSRAIDAPPGPCADSRLLRFPRSSLWISLYHSQQGYPQGTDFFELRLNSGILIPLLSSCRLMFPPSTGPLAPSLNSSTLSRSSRLRTLLPRRRLFKTLRTLSSSGARSRPWLL